ncbi:MAG: hypothetical protein WCO02_16805 [Bacteroidota bacterium]
MRDAGCRMTDERMQDAGCRMTDERMQDAGLGIRDWRIFSCECLRKSAAKCNSEP